ncbi:MAG: hypothetical protein ACI4UX_00045 [Clostridia bacterium]
MENASKALLIAGGVLIAILILSVLVVTINIINSNQKAKEQALITKQLVEFNQKYEAYNKKALYGIDIITLKGMAKSDDENIQIIIKDKSGSIIDVDLNTNKTAIFKCIDVEYNNGRISKLEFEKIKD